jgi:hypothetical protein
VEESRILFFTRNSANSKSLSLVFLQRENEWKNSSYSIITLEFCLHNVHYAIQSAYSPNGKERYERESVELAKDAGSISIMPTYVYANFWTIEYTK